MSFITSPGPPRVIQQTDEMCWAAALESWLAAVRLATRTQKQIAALWGGENGQNPNEFKKKLAKHYSMEFRMVEDFPPPREMEQTLRRFRYIYLAYKQNDIERWWHCVVLFGVNTPINDEPTYVVMDPNEKAAPDYYDRTKSEFFQLGKESRVLFGWKTAGH